MILKLPTAWLQLKYEKVRLLVAIAGISFAVVLMFMQLGFRAALFDSAVQLHTSLQGEFFLISPRSTALIAMTSFSERRLSQALAFKEVAFVAPIYLGFAQWKNPQNPSYWRNIHVIGFDIRYSIFNLLGVQKNIDKLQLPDVVLFDEASRPEFGAIASELKEKGTITTEIDNLGTGIRQITVGGLFKLGTSFGVDGNLVTSHLNFLRIFTQRTPGHIELGLIKLVPGTHINSIKKKLREYLPSDVKVLSKQELIYFEKRYWMTSTAIGYIFDLGVAMGLIVGIVFVYQILYTNVCDHLAEYATLKAMGYMHTYLLSVVFQQAIILAILGYIPGFILSSVVYKLAKNATLLPIAMQSTRAFFVLILTGFMCFISGVLAVHKLKAVDPSEIF